LYCRDTRHLRDVLNDKIQTIEGVERTETFISLEPSLERAIRI
ncbi:MAG TPA: Lrp/AsnC ligand binding domain-containing protein, partial [bacterium]|nr:Lrp/AsnC ligand binding domain-containing protein [bacterium]HNM15843.1 Lrp/AsnC ligand binding domain-containing protein [bacterium]